MGYAELHCLSNFSFLRGASHPAELVAQAAHEGYRALALTDECSLAGVVKAHVAARMHGLHLIVGAEFRLDSDCLLVLLAPDRAAYAELSGLITLARRRSPKGEYTLGLHDIEQVIHCCLAIWLPGSGAEDGLAACGEALRNVFTDRLWLGVELLLGADDQAHYQRLCGIARRLALRMVACGGVLMHVAERKALADTLCAIRLGEPVQQLGTRLEPNAERHLRPLARLRRIYPPALLAETLLIASRCSFSLELVLIAELGYEHYFLTVHDIVQFARSNGILCQGRGSAANSAVCYCLASLRSRPRRIALLFERFISARSATNRPTSTSISSTNGARK
jgi:error-prone DNA polymerase